jgi:hypothetical protein
MDARPCVFVRRARLERSAVCGANRTRCDVAGPGYGRSNKLEHDGEDQKVRAPELKFSANGRRWQLINHRTMPLRARCLLTNALARILATFDRRALMWINRERALLIRVKAADRSATQHNVGNLGERCVWSSGTL